MYYFKFKDMILADIEFTGLCFKIERIYKNSVVLPMLRDNKSFNEWISNRPTSITRNNAIDLFKTAGIKSDSDFVDVTNCLSTKDCLWLTKDRDKKWSTVSLFSNPFNKVFTETARGRQGFSGRMIQTPSPELTIGGSSLKWCKKYNNGIYFYKSFGGMAELEFSGCYSEYLASQFCKYLGVSCADYRLSKVDNKICSVTKCFTSESSSSIYDGELVDDTIHLDEHIRHYNNKLLVDFKNMMVIDCLLFNVDRHDENISLLYDSNLNITGLAPMYDFDHSLFYDLSLINRSGEYIFEKLRSYVPKTYNNHTFDEQFKMCITRDMYLRLKTALVEFEFVNSDKYPIARGRLDIINRLFKWNLARLLAMIGGS